MADQARKANYCYVKVPHRAGQGDAVLTALAEAGVNLIAYSVTAGDRRYGMLLRVKLRDYARAARALGAR